MLRAISSICEYAASCWFWLAVAVWFCSVSGSSAMVARETPVRFSATWSMYSSAWIAWPATIGTSCGMVGAEPFLRNTTPPNFGAASISGLTIEPSSTSRIGRFEA